MFVLPEEFIVINKVSYTITEVEKLVWKKLVNGAVKKKNSLRTMSVATTNKDGMCSLRTVINRAVDETRKELFFHTDIRSRKCADLANNNTLTMLFYDPRQRIQIIVKTVATIHTNEDFVTQKWNTTSPKARLSYMSVDPPNTASVVPTLGYDAIFSTSEPSQEQSEIFRTNFAVISCKVTAIEFLHLDYNGNRKANFTYKNGVLEDCFWAVP
jgi:pyridoxamine 5'-phosphate oxidase